MSKIVVLKKLAKKGGYVPLIIVSFQAASTSCYVLIKVLKEHAETFTIRCLYCNFISRTEN